MADDDDEINHTLITDHGKMFQMTIPINDLRPMFHDPRAEEDFATVRRGIGLRTGETARVATPDKEAIMELSSSFGKHRLKKQQQLLQDIAHRCREQEVTDLSGGLSKKCKISKFENKQMQREYTFHSGIYNTTKMSGTHRLAIANPATNSKSETSEKENSSPDQDTGSPSPIGRPLFERSNTMFPPRQAKKTQDRSSPSKSLPRLQISFTRGIRPESKARNSLAKTRRINGPIQLRHYLQPKQDQLAPLVLPSIKFIGYKKDNVGNYINSRKITIAPREPQGVAKGNQSPYYDTVSLPVCHPARSNTSYGQWPTSRSALGAVSIPPTASGKKSGQGTSKYVVS